MKRFLVILLALAMIFTLVGCGDGNAKDTASGGEEKLKIGFIPLTLNNEFFITMVKAAEEKAEELGVQLDVQATDQHADASAQLEIVENMITSGVDGIIIVPSSSEGLLSSLQRCKETGIPVINLDTRIEQNVLDEAGIEVPFYGTDNYAGAELAGKAVVEQFAKGIETAILTGIKGQESGEARRDGFLDAVEGHVNIVAEQSANWEVDQGYVATQNIITANPDVKLIFSCNDGMAIGALRAVEEANKDISIIGFDAISEALNLVKEEKLYGTVAQFPAEMGIKSIENMVKLLNDEEAETYIDTGTKFITKDNVDEHIEYTKKYLD